MEKVNRKPRLGPAKGVNITQEQYRKAVMRRHESSKRFIDAQRRMLFNRVLYAPHITERGSVLESVEGSG